MSLLHGLVTMDVIIQKKRTISFSKEAQRSSLI
nr:MAG TPA: hypothetical protein [Caudoviricetes sp.]